MSRSDKDARRADKEAKAARRAERKARKKTSESELSTPDLDSQNHSLSLTETPNKQWPSTVPGEHDEDTAYRRGNARPTPYAYGPPSGLHESLQGTLSAVEVHKVCTTSEKRAASIEVGEEEQAREKRHKSASEGKGLSNKTELVAVIVDSYPFSDDVLGELGRAFARLGGVFTPILQIADKGVEWELACQEWLARQRMRNTSLESDTDSDLDELEPETSVTIPEKERPAVESPVNMSGRAATLDPDPRELSHYNDNVRYLIEGWNILCSLLPGFREEMREQVRLRKPIKGICQKIQNAVKGARGNDTNGLRQASLFYVNPNLERPKTKLGEDTDKAIRGWTLPETAAALLPMKYALTAENIQLAKTRKIETDHSLFPRYLYPADHVYKPLNEDEGLFRGHYIVHAIKHIFTSPSSATEGPKNSGKQTRGSSVADLIGMKKLTPRAVAYATCQAHFALTDQVSWNKHYYDFDMDMYYWNIADILADGPDGEAILEFLNDEVFGVEQVAPATSKTSGMKARLLAQRKSRAA